VFAISQGLWGIYSKRGLIQWSARHFEQVQYALVWSIAFVLIERNIQLCGGILDLFSLSFAARWCLNNVFGTGFLSLFLLRAWLVHFDYHSGVALTNLKGPHSLDAMTDEQRAHWQWFLDNKRANTYGAPKYVQRFTFAMVCGVNLFLFGWSLLSETSFIYGMVAIWAALIIVAIGITRHLTLIDDHFFIREEMLLEFRCLALLFMIGGIVIILGPAMGWDIAGFILIELSVLCIAAMCGVATFWTMRKTVAAGLDSVSGAPKMDLPPNSPLLSVVLRDAKAVPLLLAHLVQELSVENLFFLADVMEFKKVFVSRNVKVGDEGFSCAYPRNLARLHFRRTFTEYAWAISKTYVDGGSALYVTAISEHLREGIMDSLADREVEDEEKQRELQSLLEELHTVFDDAAAEVFEQVTRAYSRFAHTPAFEGLKALRLQSGKVEVEMAEEEKETNQ